ncbi:hypothetical protein BJX64DRAFT_166768 [Aspergillus heterothallicus]
MEEYLYPPVTDILRSSCDPEFHGPRLVDSMASCWRAKLRICHDGGEEERQKRGSRRNSCVTGEAPPPRLEPVALSTSSCHQLALPLPPFHVYYFDNDPIAEYPCDSHAIHAPEARFSRETQTKTRANQPLAQLRWSASQLSAPPPLAHAGLIVRSEPCPAATVSNNH